MNFKNVSKLKKCSIKDLLNSENSSKYKNWDKNENKKLLLKLINFGKDKIPLSEKTKSFFFC